MKRCKNCRFYVEIGGPTATRLRKRACMAVITKSKNLLSGKEVEHVQLGRPDPRRNILPAEYHGKRPDPHFSCKRHQPRNAPYRRPAVLDMDLGAQKLMTYQQGRQEMIDAAEGTATDRSTAPDAGHVQPGDAG